MYNISLLGNHAWQFLKTFIQLKEKSLLWINVLARHIGLWICQGIAFFLFAQIAWTETGAYRMLRLRMDHWLLSFLTQRFRRARGVLELLLANYCPTPLNILIAQLCRV